MKRRSRRPPTFGQGKVQSAAMIGVLKMMSMSAGQPLYVLALERALDVPAVHVLSAFHALADEGWCCQGEESHVFYATADFWAFCHIVNQHFVQTVDTLDERTLALMKLGETPEAAP